MELRLDRQLADRRIFPAIDPVASGTRKEELLLDTQMAPLIWAVRRLLANMNNTERAMDMLIKSIRQTDDNNEFLLRTARKAQHSKTETLEL
jgi:transcription termination factor Rho